MKYCISDADCKKEYNNIVSGETCQLLLTYFNDIRTVQAHSTYCVELSNYAVDTENTQ